MEGLSRPTLRRHNTVHESNNPRKNQPGRRWLMRTLYSIAWWLAMPVVLARLWWRGRREPGYREHVAERFGFYRAISKQPIIWIHAVSVGETRAAEPLVDALLASYPSHTILLTHMTPTGRATGRTLFEKHASRVRQCFLPYDTGWMAARFIKHFSPSACVLMETEVWPNLIAQCVQHNVPIALVNARLSARSLAKAERLSGLMRDAAAGISCVAAQTDADAIRFRKLGVRDVQVTGSVKFDVTPPEAALEQGASMRAKFGARPVLLCASTREGEEALILDAMKTMPSDNALIVIVPRHPQRFDEVARLVASRGFGMMRRSASETDPVTSGIKIFLGDSMGEMFSYYAACDVAFVGGSLLPLGGQNLIEACALGRPVLIGPHTFNFGPITEDAIEAGAALRVGDAVAMLEDAARLLHSDGVRTSMGMCAKAFSQQHRGATERTVSLLQSLIK